MSAFKFKTKISENGTIQVPLGSSLYNKEVEIIIVPKQTKREKEFKATDFVNKWAGFLNDSNVDDIKYDYLMEKYK
ncbi:MAG TPA: hypothetical protein VFI78_01075 [Salinimicrobium sp.]|nr:hypothetical protein [Salinimicrobium sp.]